MGWVERIGTLYHINNQRRDLWDASKPLPQQSAAFMEQHHALETNVKKMAQQRDDDLAQKDLAAPRRSVLTSLKNHWEGLTVFLDHPEARMDNNISEQAARKGAIGRNNDYGSGSVWSGNLAAMSTPTPGLARPNGLLPPTSGKRLQPVTGKVRPFQHRPLRDFPCRRPLIL